MLKFSPHILPCDTPDEYFVTIFEDISQDPENEEYHILVNELL